jgi:hypothetical protein
MGGVKEKAFRDPHEKCQTPGLADGGLSHAFIAMWMPEKKI